jgi:hypothetical protein
MTADYWLLCAPAAGIAINVAAQLVLARLLPSWRLLPLLVVAFAFGLAAAGSVVVHALWSAGYSTIDAAALAASVLVVYGAAGLVLFAVVNLGETSLRIRMMRILLNAPQGVKRADLIASYDDRALIAVRLQRLHDSAQVRVADGVYYARPSILFMAAAGIRLAKRVIYGRR